MKNIKNQKLKCEMDVNILNQVSSSSLFQQINKVVGKGLIIVDKNYNLVFMNSLAKKIFGLEVEENLPSKVQQQTFIPLFRELAETHEKIISKELKLPTNDPSKEKLIGVMATPLADSEKDEPGFIVTLTDVSLTREREKLQTEFVSHVSHELCTPLTIMKEFVSILLDGLGGKLTSTQEEYLGIIHNNMDRLAQIISSLLEISQLEAGKVKLASEIANIKRLIQQTIYFLRPHLKEKNISLTVSLPSSLPPLHIDVNRITQVLTNLIENANKYTPVGGRVRVKAERKVEEVRISVSDTGEGIPLEDREKIFDRFYQVGLKPGPGAKGVGLGLPICREIVRMHQGKIWVESKMGKGSTFIFTLPCTKKTKDLSEYVKHNIDFARVTGRKFVLMNISLENYPEIEEKLGRKETRRIINKIRKTTANELRKSTDYGPLVRGEDLFLGLPKTDKEGAVALKNRLEEVLRKQKFPLPLSLKTGLALYPDGAGTEEELIRQCLTSGKGGKIKIG